MRSIIPLDGITYSNRAQSRLACWPREPRFPAFFDPAATKLGCGIKFLNSSAAQRVQLAPASLAKILERIAGGYAIYLLRSRGRREPPVFPHDGSRHRGEPAKAEAAGRIAGSIFTSGLVSPLWPSLKNFYLNIHSPAHCGFRSAGGALSLQKSPGGNASVKTRSKRCRSPSWQRAQARRSRNRHREKGATARSRRSGASGR